MIPPDPNRQLPGILLIDDDAISREVLAMMLELYGFSVHVAEDGVQALALLADFAGPNEVVFPSVILMDTQMPGLSGLELVQALREWTQARGNTRIIAISGSQVSADIREATDGFLLKPIQAEDLAALLSTASTVQEPVKEPSGSSEPASSEVIDPVVLGKLKAMMPASAVMEIYLAVSSDLKSRLVTLEAAMESENAGEVARIAHTIKGGCGMVGLRGATEAASRLETSNLSGTWRKELLQLHFALGELQSILGNGLL